LGSELFQDSESFLEELTDDTLDHLVGAGDAEDELFIQIPSYVHGKTFKGTAIHSLKIKNFTVSNKTGIMRTVNVG
jgi:hypothetical protein